MTGDIQPLKHGMTTDELLAAWKRRLPNTEPTDNQLSCFAIGIEVGRATDAQDTHLIAAAVRAGERARLRSIIMAKHEAAKGQHNLYHCLAVELMEQGADVITFLAAPPAPAAVPPDGMDTVAIKYAHKMALDLECILAEYGGSWYNTAMQTLGEYRSEMNAIHERECPTFMGEPVIAAAGDKP